MRSVVILLTLAVLVLTGCSAPASQGQPAAADAWSLAVVVGSTTTQMSLTQLKALPQIEVEFLSKETGTNNSYRGVLLRELCQNAGADVSAIQSVDAEADDGFLATLNRELATGDGVFLVTEMDGGPLPAEMGVVRMLAPGEATKFQVKQVKRIIVK